MAYLGWLLTNGVPQDRIRSYGVRFVASVTGSGRVIGAEIARKLAVRFVRAAVSSFGGLDVIVDNARYTWPPSSRR
jgi:hypothetical protein